jgi:hypothetical protein
MVNVPTKYNITKLSIMAREENEAMPRHIDFV